jgi:phosphoglycolate phosphatase
LTFLYRDVTVFAVPPKAVIFDLDGTLVDTLADIGSAMNTVLIRHGMEPLPLENYRSRVGWGLRELARRTLPESMLTSLSLETIAREFFEAYARYPVRYTAEYSGVSPLVRLLRSHNIRLAVFSNKPDPLVQIVVDHFFSGLFVWARGSRDGIPRKPNPVALREAFEVLKCSPEETAMVGDSEVDMETARNAGCVPIGVGWGYRDGKTVADAGARFVVDTASELQTLLMNGWR